METKEEPDKKTIDLWHKDPKNWKFGIFYFNKRDKRIVLPKRLKLLGWTINFANPVSYLILLAAIMLLVLIEKNWK